MVVGQLMNTWNCINRTGAEYTDPEISEFREMMYFI